MGLFSYNIVYLLKKAFLVHYGKAVDLIRKVSNIKIIIYFQVKEA